MTNFFADKKVLVTGAVGFVGHNLVKRLVELGAIVTGTTHKSNLSRCMHNVQYIQVDLTNEQDCLAVTKNQDFVFMAAANSSGAEVIEKTPLVHLTPNVIMNARMLEAARINKVQKFCFISSNTVYPLTDYPVVEGDADFSFFEKYFVVGWMKRFSEIMCEMYSEKIEFPMPTLIIRPGNLYGPFDKFRWTESKVIAALIRRALERHTPFVVWGDGLDIKDFLYIDDFIDGLIKAFETNNSSRVYNIASGYPVTIRDVITSVLKHTNYEDANVVFDSSKPAMIPRRLINIDRITAETTWRPQTALDDGIEQTIDWYRQAYSLATPEEVDNDYL